MARMSTTTVSIARRRWKTCLIYLRLIATKVDMMTNAARKAMLRFDDLHLSASLVSYNHTTLAKIITMNSM
ncbi:uncharacterized protein PHALS_14682 [Plasmopara halstedii]|uniref:Uncharacterized protein n=1 Tax=Plasmopara halstedii TaxID=4781 RepID=A0A0P1AP98_PLAHL|nr:uncharacterized protein PHALS_14682 [Plasmopara halstedii]CEG43063.1 hypothetical protein PHALS_14682 [Plasmopara halstedii]|eukprot:XP_024579432.1 hypothetical protein PHALS_14682 [Plasmopara halstedii]